jgi:hypothetical protein
LPSHQPQPTERSREAYRAMEFREPPSNFGNAY